MNHKKLQRLWREDGLRVPQRRRRKRLGTSTTAAVVVADAPNAVWGIDFQFDATNDGRPIKLVSIVDEHTRESLGGLVERSITADKLTGELDRIAADRGYPAALRADNGPELTCTAMSDWAAGRVGLAFIPPSEPWRNGHIESFNGRVRDECLNINVFGPWPTPGSSSPTGIRIQLPSQALRPGATRPQPDTPPPAPTELDSKERPRSGGARSRCALHSSALRSTAAEHAVLLSVGRTGLCGDDALAGGGGQSSLGMRKPAQFESDSRHAAVQAT